MLKKMFLLEPSLHFHGRMLGMKLDNHSEFFSHIQTPVYLLVVLHPMFGVGRDSERINFGDFDSPPAGILNNSRSRGFRNLNDGHRIKVYSILMREIRVT